MTPGNPSDLAHWEKLQELFHLIEGVPDADRDRALIDAGADAELRTRVLKLLRAGSRNQAAKPAADAGPQSFGPYRVIQRIGSGGIGTVYLVERDAGDMTQRAALKVLAPHAAGPDFADRFRREQWILGSLDHPNITRLIDAGFGARDEPYLVMEYVEGEHLDAYCDLLKLSIEGRLQLFVKIAGAVAYAHRMLIVHLDLKPSNILVTPQGAPKLLDFGTSKVLAADGGSTSTLPVTPSYASPEQLRNEAVTTSCDVYSLGVILFEMLVGARPAGEASMAAMIERAIAETEPRPIEQSVTGGAAEKRGVSLQRLRSALSGDLSIIVAKALAPRAGDRYVSVDALAADVERFLDGRPVLAQRQTTVYRMKKFVRRNSGKVTLSAVMLMALIATGGYAWWKQRQALHEAHRALVMQTFMSNLFRAANSNITGKPVSTITELLRLGVQIVPDFIKDPDDLRQARLSLAESLYLSSDFATAQTLYEQALESAVTSKDKSAEAEALSQLGLIAYFSGKTEAALNDTEHGYAASRGSGIPVGTRLLGAQAYVLVHEDLNKTTDQNVAYLKSAIKEARAAHIEDNHISAALIQLGQLQTKRGRYDDAIHTFQEGIALIKNDRLATCDEASALYGMGGVYRSLDQNDKAAPVLREAYQRMRSCYGDSPFTLQTLGYWADAMIQSGRAKEALPELEASEPFWKTGSMNRMAASQNFVFLGRAYLADSQFKSAEQAAIHGFELIYGQGGGQVGPLDRGLGLVHLVWAMALAGQGHHTDAMAHAEIADRILSNNPQSPSAKRWASHAHELSDQLSALPK